MKPAGFLRRVNRATASIHATSNTSTRTVSSFVAQRPCPPARCFHQSARQLVVKPYILADIGEGITECQIISWSVKPGDHVEQFEPICEVQSDKATVEITSRFDGVIKALHYAQDDIAIVGQALLDMDIADDVADDPLLGGASADIAPPPEPEVESQEAVQRSFGLSSQAPTAETASTSSPSESPAPAKSAGKSSALVTPAVRHMIKEAGVDISQIPATGKGDRILKEDVQRYLTGTSAPKPAAAAPTITPTTSIPTVSARAVEDQTVPLSPVESQMFKAMTHSLTIPHFLYSHRVDLTSVNALRRKVNGSPPLSSSLSSGLAPKLSPLPFIMKALSQTFLQHPKLNAHLDTTTNPSKPQLVLKGAHHFGLAIDTAQGLLVPVVRNVQNHSIFSLAAEIKRISDLAHAGRLAPDDFRGATFTVSNIGSIGGAAVGPVIVAPMVGILGIGRTEAVPVFEEDGHGGERIVKREQAVFSWSADHRILDGATVAKAAEVMSALVRNAETLGLALR